ncbi:MAG: DUF1592 domain-containing protein [Nannocystaceae bacterium]
MADACDGRRPGPAPIRRLNRREYDNTARDLLLDDSRPASAFPPEEEALGFNNNADALVVTPILAELYLDAAEALAAAAVADHLPDLLGGCDPDQDGADACADRFIKDFGRWVYRRPLDDDDVAALSALFSAAEDQFDFETAVRLTLTAMLQSPHFLYRVEVGAPIEGDEDNLRVGPYELASRLSYFLWGTMPDAALFNAASSGGLDTAAQVADETRRMLADPRARETVRDFHGQWLRLAHIDELEKDPDLYPDFDPALLPLLRAEADALIDDVVWEGGGDFGTLLSAPYTFLNKALADYYGVEGPSGDAFERVDLPPGHASGILTQGGLMSVLAKHNQSDPIHRGKFVREGLLCQLIPPPPDNVMAVPPEVDPDLPTRERFEEHTKEPLCAGCHQMMDPIGFGFEHFDGIGRWREIEAGQPIDARGELLGATVSGEFDGVPGLAALLDQSPEVDACLTKQWFRYAYGRVETLEDRCTLDALSTRFSDSGRDIQDLLVALTQTDAFLLRPVAGEGDPE